MMLKNRIVILLATGGYCGFSPKAPGTVGSLLALPFVFAMDRLAPVWSVVFVCTFSLIGAWLAHVAEKSLNQTDPGCIVIDEIAGLMVTFLGIQLNIFTVCAGFVIFRLLDIFKPFPIGWLEKQVSGGPGIMADDIAAGIIGNILLRIIMTVGVI